MRFAKIVFWIAAIWGVLILTPLYFMFDLIGRNDPPPIRIRDSSTDLWVQGWHGRSCFSLSRRTRSAIDR